MTLDNTIHDTVERNVTSVSFKSLCLISPRKSMVLGVPEAVIICPDWLLVSAANRFQGTGQLCDAG
ncbi:hypothetical protein E2C01_080219 [Portunus trituberculatus]|uniref:Uncharacterized protein n=1 Tax=Portunus trituberculatus TaxID=210409 RepID=A0A5B7INQ2_PORTR|nr:hypothetical protein [Portunus trituberculatus]